MLLGKLRPSSIEKVALLFCPIPNLRAVRRSGSRMDGARVLARSEPRHTVVMRAEGEVVVKRLLKSRKLFSVVIAFKEDDVSGIDLADFGYYAPIDGIHAVEIRLVVGINVPRIIAQVVVRTRLIEYIVAGHYTPVPIAPRKLLPKCDEAILIGRNFPKQADARRVVRMPVDILPSLGRMEIENNVKAMIFAVA